MTPRGIQLQRSLAMTLELVKEHEKLQPAEVELIYRGLVAHIRSARPMALLDGELCP